MMARVALSLAWSAALALLAYPAQAQIIGQQSGILGGEAGFLRPAGAATPSTVTLDALPYTRTVSCGTYTLTGTYTGSAPTGWTASPSGASGACTDLGAGSFSCAVDVDPDATGEGVETITVGTETATLGFYVDGEHTCFLAQSVNGAYNVGLADLDAVSTWENLGSSALDVTQPGAATLKPTFRTSIVNGQPVVRCDGGDRMNASGVVGWAYLHDGTGSTVQATVSIANSGLNTITATSSGVGTNTGFGWRTNTTALAGYFTSDGVTLKINMTSANNVFTANTFNNHTVTLASADTPDATGYINGTSVASASAAAFSSANPANALRICASGGDASLMTGDIFALIYYPSSLTSTQRGINKAVDEWALGGTLPVVAALYNLDAADSASITTSLGVVSSWRSDIGPTADFTQATGNSRPTPSGSGQTAEVDFDGSNDTLFVGTQTPTANSHVFAVVTIDAINTNGTGASCGTNDTIYGFVTAGRLALRSSGGTSYAIGVNNDGSVDCAEVAITIGSKQILEYKVDGTNVSVAVDGGAFTSTASGNTSVSSQTAVLGSSNGASNLFDGAIHEVVAFTDDLDSAARAEVLADLQAKWGIP